MKDTISIERLNRLHPKARDTFRAFIEEAEAELGIALRITTGYRTIAEQDVLYAQGRTTVGDIVTNAKGGQSFHNYGLAVDLCRLSDDLKHVQWSFDMAQLKPIAAKHGIEWGGDWKHFKDYPHFELRLGFKQNCEDALVKVRRGEVDGEGYVLA